MSIFKDVKKELKAMGFLLHLPSLKFKIKNG